LPQYFKQERKGSTISEGSGLSYEEKLFLIESLFEEFEKLASENDAQGFDREEKVFAGRDPTVLIARQSPSGDKTVEMKMIQEDLVPGMQNSGQT